MVSNWTFKEKALYLRIHDQKPPAERIFPWTFDVFVILDANAEKATVSLNKPLGYPPDKTKHQWISLSLPTKRGLESILDQYPTRGGSKMYLRAERQISNDFVCHLPERA